MGTISSRVALTHRATIQRATAVTDDWGNPGVPTWSNHLTDLPCRAWVTAGRETLDADTTVVVEDMRLLCALGTDVTERDRVATVTDRGAVVAAGPVGIRAVLTHRDHLELVLVRVA